MTLDQLAQIFNQEFQEPFLPDGMVQVRMNDDGTMRLQIDRRDVHINEDGEVLGAGTALDYGSVSVSPN